MGDILQVPVPNGQAANCWGARGSPGVSSLLFINQDLNNTVWLGQVSTITPAGPNTIPIAPNGTFSGSATSAWYVVGSAAGIQPLVVVPNGQAYFLGLTAGLGNLVIPSVQSPNFVHDVSGWQIAKDGSAEFNNVTIRGGELIAGVFLAYDGTPAAGNLILSFSGSNGVDEFGNHYDQGLWAYNLSGGGGAALLPGADPTLFLQPPSTAHAGTAPQAQGAAGNTGAANEYQALTLYSGNEAAAGGNSGIQLYSESNDATAAARGQATINGVPVFGWNASGVSVDGYVQLPGVATPASPGSPVVYGTTAGGVNVVDSADGDTYNTQRRTQFLPSGGGVTCGAVTGTVIFGKPVAAKAYQVSGVLILTANAAVSFSMEFAAPAGASGQVTATIVRAAVVIGTAVIPPNALTGVGGALLGGGDVYLCYFDGIIVCTAAGTLTLEGAVSAAGAGVTADAFSYWNVSPQS